MRYNDNAEQNEYEHIDNGERELVNMTELRNFLGSDNYNAKAEEMLLDILNDQYPVSDAINDVQQHDN